MSLLSPEPRFRHDDGSADPAATAALAAYAAGTGSEHAALSALAAGRLLVPVVAAVTEQAEPGDRAGQDGAAARTAQAAETAETARAGVTGGGAAAEKSSEMAVPSLIGRDGRAALPVFTSLAALASWRPGARPVPTAAERVWQAAVAEGSAVVIDVAGPVPLVVEGARLAALADGRGAPRPEQDPDIRSAVAAAVAAVDPAAEFRLVTPPHGTDLAVELALPAGAGREPADAIVGQVGEAVVAAVGDRLRRDIAITLRRRSRA
ncbi:MAG: SseB family protein [Streptosporangiaceae bacterium]